MKTKLKIIVLTLLITQFSFSQKKSRADRFFEKGDYINAAIQYEEELNNEGYSKHILKNISTSYYNTFQFKEAYRYLKILTSGKFYDSDKTYENEYNFKTYQVLSALGYYEKAVEFLALYKKNQNTTAFNKADAISIIEDFKLKDEDYSVKNSEINSESAEFGAIKRDSIIYFSSDRNPSILMRKNYKWTHRPFLDIFKVSVDEDNKPVSEVEGISKKINSKLHEGNFCFSLDGNILYISKSNSEKGKKKFDSIHNNAIHLYKSTKVEGEWTAPEKLNFNDVGYSIEHPAIHPDGTKLYFSSNMPGGHGDFDIYYVDINEDGTYGIPQNSGKTINTENREQFPFIDAKGHLFFSSNGHLGLGMMDIFVSELKEGVHTRPINLGAPINSSYDDFSLAYYNETDGFFASNRSKSGDDLYQFKQTGEIFLREYKARFEVKDYSTDSYIPNSSVVIYDVDKNVITDKKLDSIAAFDINIFPGKYEFKAVSDGYEEKIKPIFVKEKEEETYIIYLNKKTVDDKVTSAIADSKEKEDVPSGAALRNKLLNDKVGPPVIEKNGKLYFDLPTIYFDYDKWSIRADSKKVLDEFALKLDKYKSVYITISSHTDSRGSESYNQVLSDKRAESTRNYLALVGYVNARRMKYTGYGESQPLVNCEEKSCTEEDHQTNRRSEFEIVKY